MDWRPGPAPAALPSSRGLVPPVSSAPSSTPSTPGRRNPPRGSAQKAKGGITSSGPQDLDPKTLCNVDGCESAGKKKQIASQCKNQVCTPCCKAALRKGSFVRNGEVVPIQECRDHRRDSKSKRKDKQEAASEHEQEEEEESTSSEEEAEEDETYEDNGDDDEQEEEVDELGQEEFFRKRYRDMQTRTKKKQAQASRKPTVKREEETIITKDKLRLLWQHQGGRCALTNRKMIMTKNCGNVGSLDRIDPRRGYVEGNVQWVCWWVNRMKGEMQEPHFFNRCLRLAGAYPDWQRLKGKVAGEAVDLTCSLPLTPTPIAPGPSTPVDTSTPRAKKKRKLHKKSRTEGSGSAPSAPGPSTPVDTGAAHPPSKKNEHKMEKESRTEGSESSQHTSIADLSDQVHAIRDLLRSMFNFSRLDVGSASPDMQKNKGKKRKASDGTDGM